MIVGIGLSRANIQKAISIRGIAIPHVSVRRRVRTIREDMVVLLCERLEQWYEIFLHAGICTGVGFVMGAWCPGTAAVGLAAGRIDALVFLLGVMGGSILFNEFFPLIHALYTAGDHGTQMAYTTVGMSRNGFILAFTLVAVAAFWLAEWAEKVRTGRAPYRGSPFLKAFSLALVALAGGLFVLSPDTTEAAANSAAAVTPSTRRL